MATRAGGVDRGAVVALALAAPLALGAVIAWAPLKDVFPPVERPEPYTPLRKPATKGKAPAPKKGQEVPTPDAPPRSGSEVAPPPKPAEQARALRGCRLLAQAIEVYAAHPDNPGTSDAERLPKSVEDLVKPPFGGTSFLPNGAADLSDPWGQPYTAQPDLTKAGEFRLIIATVAPDGTRVTQFGIGPAADPKD